MGEPTDHKSTAVSGAKKSDETIKCYDFLLQGAPNSLLPEKELF